MAYVLDTNVLVDLYKGQPVVSARVRAATYGGPLFINPVVLAELLGGYHRMPGGKKKQDYQKNLHDLLATFTVEPITAESAECFARLKVQQEQAGFALADQDLWIASTAMTKGLRLVTRDSDFSRVPDLVIENWSAPVSH
jgi:predicted nucleic acid-binding protein